ncbi:MAG TPA: hypothetical protein DDW52_02375 [Planctomycetaceae bacterium]|nr:hypothetical protein [Planctomycetaceae bacterium]
MNVVQRNNSHLITVSGSALRRYDLASGQEEAVVFDLTELNKRAGSYRITSSENGGWFSLRQYRDKDDIRHYLFDESVWACSDPIQPIATWKTGSLYRCQLFESERLIVQSQDMGRRNELQVRRLEDPNAITKRVAIPGKFHGGWLEGDRLLAYCAKNSPPLRMKLLDIDLTAEKINGNAVLPPIAPPDTLHRLLPEPGALLVSSLDSRGTCCLLMLRAGQPSGLLAASERVPSLKTLGHLRAIWSSPNGRFVSWLATPHTSQLHILDLKEVREIAELSLMNREKFVTLTNDARFLVTSIDQDDNGVWSQKLFVYELY